MSPTAHSHFGLPNGRDKVKAARSPTCYGLTKRPSDSELMKMSRPESSVLRLSHNRINRFQPFTHHLHSIGAKNPLITYVEEALKQVNMCYCAAPSLTNLEKRCGKVSGRKTNLTTLPAFTASKESSANTSKLPQFHRMKQASAEDGVSDGGVTTDG